MDPTAFIFEEPEEREFYVFPNGKAKWRIHEINTMTQSKNGNPVLPIQFEFYDEAGNTARVYENFVFIASAAFKINQFLKCCSGQMTPGRKINFDDIATINWLKARTGEAILAVEDVPGKTYKRNKIASFVYEGSKVSGASVSTPQAKPQPPSAPVDEIDDDDIPF